MTRSDPNSEPMNNVMDTGADLGDAIASLKTCQNRINSYRRRNPLGAIPTKLDSALHAAHRALTAAHRTHSDALHAQYS